MLKIKLTVTSLREIGICLLEYGVIIYVKYDLFLILAFVFCLGCLGACRFFGRSLVIYSRVFKRLGIFVCLFVSSL